MAEEGKEKVNVNEDGTPKKFGDEGYLIGGKYKTVEDAEKGIKEAGQKITELGQGKSASDKALIDFQQGLIAREEEAKKGKLKTADEERLERIKNFKKVFEDPEGGGPAAAYAFVEQMISDSHKRRDTKAGEIAKQRQTLHLKGSAAVNRVRGTGDKALGIPEDKARQKEFDLLKPVMDKIWSKMPDSSKVPEMLETVFLAARATASPELKEQIVAGIKAGTGVTDTGLPPADAGKTKDEKTVDDIIDQADKDKGGL